MRFKKTKTSANRCFGDYHGCCLPTSHQQPVEILRLGQNKFTKNITRCILEPTEKILMNRQIQRGKVDLKSYKTQALRIKNQCGKSTKHFLFFFLRKQQCSQTFLNGLVLLNYALKTDGGKKQIYLVFHHVIQWATWRQQQIMHLPHNQHPLHVH